MAITNMPLGVTAVMLPELDFDEQVALCQRLRVTHYSIRPRIITDEFRGKPYGNWGNHKFDLTPQRLLAEAGQIKRKLADAGLVPFGTVPTATTTDSDDALKLHFEGAAAVGAGRVRVAPEAYPKTAFNYAQLLDKVVQRYGQIIKLAQGYGIKVVVEMHARSLATSPGLAYNIVRHFSPQQIGLIFDLPNFAIEGNITANLAVAAVRDYIDHLHVGGTHRTTSGYDANGFRTIGNTMCPLTQCDIHVPTYLAALRDAGVAVPLIIENYTPNMPGAMRLEQTARELQQLLSVL